MDSGLLLQDLSFAHRSYSKIPRLSVPLQLIEHLKSGAMIVQIRGCYKPASKATSGQLQKANCVNTGGDEVDGSSLKRRHDELQQKVVSGQLPNVNNFDILFRHNFAFL